MNHTLALGLAAAVLLAGCEEEKIEKETPPPIGVMELPVSSRVSDTAPQGARVDVAPDAVYVDGTSVQSVKPGAAKTAIASAVASRVKGSSAAVRVHANAPYEVLFSALAGLAKAGVSKVAFEVRKGSSPDTGWLAIERMSFGKAGAEPSRFDGAGQLTWDEFTQAWNEMNGACSGPHSVACDGPPEEPLVGGDAQLTLFIRGNAAKLQFDRFNAPAPKAASAPVAMLDGLAPTPVAAAREPEGPTSAAFTWRSAATTAPQSPIGATLRPLCGQRMCAVVVEAESRTPAFKVLSFLGAAFPDGTRPPEVRFVM